MVILSYLRCVFFHSCQRKLFQEDSLNIDVLFLRINKSYHLASKKNCHRLSALSVCLKPPHLFAFIVYFSGVCVRCRGVARTTELRNAACSRVVLPLLSLACWDPSTFSLSSVALQLHNRVARRTIHFACYVELYNCEYNWTEGVYYRCCLPCVSSGKRDSFITGSNIISIFILLPSLQKGFYTIMQDTLTSSYEIHSCIISSNCQILP